MNEYYCGCMYVTKTGMRRGALIDRIGDMVDDARDKFGKSNLTGATATLRRIQRLLDKELPKGKRSKRKAKK